LKEGNTGENQFYLFSLAPNFTCSSCSGGSFFEQNKLKRAPLFSFYKQMQVFMKETVGGR